MTPDQRFLQSLGVIPEEITPATVGVHLTPVSDHNAVPAAAYLRDQRIWMKTCLSLQDRCEDMEAELAEARKAAERWIEESRRGWLLARRLSYAVGGLAMVCFALAWRAWSNT